MPGKYIYSSVSQHLTTQAWDLRQIWWFQRVKWRQKRFTVFALARIHVTVDKFIALVLVHRYSSAHSSV